MDKALNKKGWLWFWLGYTLCFLLQLYMLFGLSPRNYTWMMWLYLPYLACIPLVCVGLRYCALARGRSPYWGLLGLFHVFGFLNIISAIVVARLDDLTAAIWHYRQDDKNIGPLALSEVSRQIHNGTISPNTLLWRIGKKDWMPARVALPTCFTSIPPVPPQIDTNQKLPSLPTGAPAQSSVVSSQRKNGLSIASLVCGVIGSVFSITSIPAVICGHIALHNIKSDPTKYGGKGMAIAGLILGYIAIVLGLILGTMKGILWAQLRQMGY